ncbi:MAG TPA: methylmalonyl-CoA mutase family protein [Bacteroidota bacterium]|jgi:methylmalonyl-CoA mutase N-terminal domain/subunit|nr:methylmalonyl-CoA mutase family protein [Bacteroidota bacterium]
MYDKIKSAKENWEKTKVENFIKKIPERKNKFETDSQIEIERLYIPTEKSYDDIGFPGEYPYTRGPYPTMYRGRFWTMRQYAGFADAEESNKRYKFLLNEGTTGLSIAFDLPTQIGYDSDHPIAKSEVGKVGVAIDSLRDMEILFDGIELQKISTSMTINSTAAILLAMYVTIAKKQGADLTKISGTIQNDILKEYIARGTYIYPPKSSMRLTTNIFEWCSKNLPSWNPISISGYHIREAGSNAVQEVAFTIANGIEYVSSAVKSGLDVDSFASRLSFFFNVHNNFFEEIAKFRAARRLWAKIMKERFGAKKEESCKLRFHSQTAGSTLTAQQIDNNIVRVTIQALAAVLGGTQSLHTNARDEALSLPTEESVQIALRTQQIIAYESGVTDTIDPLAGSYFVEALTDEIEKRAVEYIKKIDDMGGSIKAIEKNYFQNEIASASYNYQQKIENQEKIIVGMNKFKTDENIKQKTFSINPEVANKQISKLQKLKSERDNNKVIKSLSDLTEAAKSENENLMPYIIFCVENYATLGEISDALRKVWGEYKG